MTRLTLAALSSVALLCTASAFADPIYPYPGKPITDSTITASNTGALIGTYLGGNTLGQDSIRLTDLTTGVTYGYAFVQATATPGEVYSLGNVTAGDTLAFQIQNNILSDPSGYYLTSGGPPNPIMSSDAQISTDGVSHTWVTPDGSGGLYVDFEDLPHIMDPNYPGFFYTDSDYNDVRLDLSTVGGDSVAPTPEPSTFLLLGTGLLGVAGAVRRRVRGI